MNPVNWFEIPVTDMGRAKAFYENILGVALELQQMGPLKMAWFPMQENASGAAGSLVLSDGYVPCRMGIVVYFSVADIEGVLRKAGARGGKILTPKTSIGEYGFIGHFEDSEGNRLGLHSMK